MISRRILLALLVIVSGGCAITQWQRDQELIASVRSLHTPGMNAVIDRAR